MWLLLFLSSSILLLLVIIEDISPPWSDIVLDPWRLRRRLLLEPQEEVLDVDLTYACCVVRTSNKRGGGGSDNKLSK